jgi:hypothetical protein
VAMTIELAKLPLAICSQHHVCHEQGAAGPLWSRPLPSTFSCSLVGEQPVHTCPAALQAPGDLRGAETLGFEGPHLLGVDMRLAPL